MLDVLVVAPHPDDAEIGAGGSILNMRNDGLEVGILDLTNGEPTPHGSPDIRATETRAASDVLGISWRKNLGLTNRELQASLPARAAVAEAIRETKPRWLFAPYWIDAHPDHVQATQLVEDARFWSKLSKSQLAGESHHPERVFYYFALHLRLSVTPSFVVDISDVWERKRQALRCYHSQFVAGLAPDQISVIDRVETQAAYWGQLIGRRYGEPMACREVLGIRHWRDLV